ncbi:uncharacterized protein VTP21DRAFT_4964 [Calcarisporiella thermophila]|uniref:uncharacterized protein n=1 Tax=Calcarisporiella thermophila TaxID=911321 RepID=UPI00374425B5
MQPTLHHIRPLLYRSNFAHATRILATRNALRAFSTTPLRKFAASQAAPKETTEFKIPADILHEIAEAPRPMRSVFTHEPLTTKDLEEIDIGLGRHRKASGLSDKIAYYSAKILRVFPDTLFHNNHYLRFVFLETIAAVPGMVGGMVRHLRSLRNLQHDGGWILHLLHEAENERMHLMTWMKVLQPNFFYRMLIFAAQGVFFNTYFLTYLISPKFAHRFTGYLEEEAVISYSHWIRDYKLGKVKNGPAPKIAIDYWNLHPDATLHDVVLAVRSDEALHRDSNHLMSDVLIQTKDFDLRTQASVVAEKTKDLYFESEKSKGNGNGVKAKAAA